MTRKKVFPMMYFFRSAGRSRFFPSPSSVPSARAHPREQLAPQAPARSAPRIHGSFLVRLCPKSLYASVPCARNSLATRTLLRVLVCAVVWFLACAIPQARAISPSVGFGVGTYGGGVSFYSGGPYSRHGRAYGGFHRAYRPYHHRHGGYAWNWIGLSVPLYPRRYYEQGSVVPVQPFPNVPANIGEVHAKPVPYSYPDQGLGLHTVRHPAQTGTPASPATEQGGLPHAGSRQPVIYPIMTHESREAWNRYQRWTHGGMSVRPGAPGAVSK